jgi:4-amino-4-deoxy-L-arabinose transferase-like glycosyltransferase
MRAARRDLVVLALVALLLRTAAAVLVSQPPYTDPAYYTLVAQQLVTGHGFQVPVLWSFLEVGGRLPADPTLPIPSNGHWMPLTSIVAAGSMLLFGTSWLAGELPMILLSVGLVLLTYQVGWELWSSRRVALSASFLALFAGPMLVYVPMVDAFAVFGTCGAGAIYASVRAVRSSSPGWWLLLSGVAVGFATLARVDGLLLAVAPATAWVVASNWRSVALRFGWGLASFVAALLVLGPWLLRNAAVFGAPFPSAGGHTLWITTYNEQFSIANDPSLASYLAWGVPAIVGSKLVAGVELVGRTGVLMGGVFVVFFAAGLWRERGRRELLPFILYFWVMFAAMALVFTFHAPMGAFYHSAWAWLPFAFPLAVASLEPTANRIGRYWRFLRGRRPQSVLLVAGLAGAMVLSLVGSASLVATWRQHDAGLRGAADYLRAHANRDERVLAYDPARVYLLTGNPGVAPPFDPFKTVARVVSAYSVKWILVTLNPGETRDPLGLWDGAAAIDSEGAHPSFLPTKPSFEAPGVRIYQVAP